MPANTEPVLLVTDLRADAAGMQAALHEAGFEHVIVHIGMTGALLEYLRLRPEAVVLDLFALETDAATLVRQFRAVGWGGVAVPVLIVDDDPSTTRVQQLVDLGGRAVARTSVAANLPRLVSSAVQSRQLSIQMTRERRDRRQSALGEVIDLRDGVALS